MLITAADLHGGLEPMSRTTKNEAEKHALICNEYLRSDATVTEDTRINHKSLTLMIKLCLNVHLIQLLLASLNFSRVKLKPQNCKLGLP